jgi:hypothetical protein
MIFSVSVAVGTGCLSRGRQIPIGLIVSGETHEFPSSSRGVTFAVLNHDIHAARLILDGVASYLFRFEQVIDND